MTYFYGLLGMLTGGALGRILSPSQEQNSNYTMLFGGIGLAIGWVADDYFEKQEKAANQQAVISVTAPSGYGTTQTYFPRYTLPPIARFEPRGEGYPPGPPWGYMRNRHIPNA